MTEKEEKEIETLRKKLYQNYKEKHLCDDVVKLSQELDDLLNKAFFRKKRSNHHISR
ncbi:aspartyl-phosphate phosphatase Spo0E family protein [Aquibacillus koreensis]|uniref:Aspartyl-phosphate phosphatase Spo0E family protein n=1 Tax=Aquibacillus koreensis TaxID=279446 RepID=A0A9X3WS47_9BACI|nr:aspartyl-phosphate phosphatase Spo0E family protein [Aquibacillus koreensis]MCT2537002.1 aspartyl-phosphate phosphatase Spo0E family protein [Aquibacillus koreensis]MDC3422344.1 aspartyl-phosphate phosphatase Spo0E family protein [Aquibacillus koreensis]